MSAAITFSDGALFSDGAGFRIWTPPVFAIITRPQIKAFHTISLPPSGIRRRPHAHTYVFGDRLFVNVVPYHGNASLVFVDLIGPDLLVTG